MAVTKSSKSMPFCMASLVGVGSRRRVSMNSARGSRSEAASSKGFSLMA